MENAKETKNSEPAQALVDAKQQRSGEISKNTKKEPDERSKGEEKTATSHLEGSKLSLNVSLLSNTSRKFFYEYIKTF